MSLERWSGVGQLVLVSRASARFAEALEPRSSRGLTPSEAEQAVFGATSAEVAAHLLALWGQPLHVVRATAHQDMPEICEPSRLGLATVIYLSKRLSRNAEAPLGRCVGSGEPAERRRSGSRRRARRPAAGQVARRLAC